MSDLPILSPYIDATHAFTKYYNQEIIPLYKPGTLIDYILDPEYLYLPWPQLLARAETMYCYGEAAKFPDIDGIFYITPDLDESWIIESRNWAQGSASRVIIDLRQPSRSQAQLIQFITPADELNFIKGHHDHILISRNQSLCQQLRWRNQEFFKFPQWHLTEQTLYNNKIFNADFLDILDTVTPNHTGIIYNILSILGVRQESKYFGTILRKILEIIERPAIGSYFEALIANKPILLCGLDTGNWPAPQSPHGKILKQILTTKTCIATQLSSYPDHSKSHNWAYYCEQITYSSVQVQVQVQPQNAHENIQSIEISSPLPLNTTINHLYNFIYDRKKFYLQAVLNLYKRKKSIYSTARAILQQYSKLEEYESNYLEYKALCVIVNKIKHHLDKFEAELNPQSVALDQKYTIQYKSLSIGYTIDRVYTGADNKIIYLQYKFGANTNVNLLSWLQDIPVFTCSQDKVLHVKAKSYEKELDEYICGCIN